MKANDQRLISFYFGSLPDHERLDIERELLSDEEVLIDYLDLKRTIEGAASVPNQPSAQLWRRLRPASVPAKVWWLSLGAGAALAAGLALFFIMQTHLAPVPAQRAESAQRFLFDSGAEQSSAANVL